MRVKASKNTTLGLMTVALVLTVLLIVFFQTYELPTDSQAIRTRPERVYVENEVYHNWIHLFKVRLPGEGWQMTCYTELDSVPPTLDDDTPWRQALSLFQAEFVDLDSTRSVVECAVGKYTKPHSALAVAHSLFAELTTGIREVDLDTLKDVTPASSMFLHGAYFVFQHRHRGPYPVEVVLVVTRKEHTAFIFRCRARAEYYDYLRQDFKTILESFTFI